MTFKKVPGIDEKGRSVMVVADYHKKKLIDLLESKGIPAVSIEFIVGFADRFFDSYKPSKIPFKRTKIKIKAPKATARQWQDYEEFMMSNRPSRSIVIDNGKKVYKFEDENLTEVFDEIFALYKKIGLYDQPSGKEPLRWKFDLQLDERGVVMWKKKLRSVRTSHEINLLNECLSALANHSLKLNFPTPLPAKNRLGNIKEQPEINVLTYEILEALEIVSGGSTTPSAKNAYITSHLRPVKAKKT